MMQATDMEEKVEPSAEETQGEEGDIEASEGDIEASEEGDMEASEEGIEASEEGEDDAGEEEEDGDEEEQDGGTDTEEEKATPQAADNVEKTRPLPVEPKNKAQPGDLNLNNEVVRMRKEVKRVRALVTRKLTRQIAALKKKKGKDTEVERNQRRAARMLEDIHAMKALSPDLVTKKALQKNLNFDQVCKNPKSTASDRAIARIATHTQFNKKIEAIKAAVKAFKEERLNGEQKEGVNKGANEAAKVTRQTPDKKVEKHSVKEKQQQQQQPEEEEEEDDDDDEEEEEDDEDDEEEEEQEDDEEEEENGEEEEEDDNNDSDITVEQKQIVNEKEGDGIPKDSKVVIVDSIKETQKAIASVDTQSKEILLCNNEEPAPMKGSEVKDIVKNEPQSKDVEKKSDLKSAPEVLQTKEADEESDLDSSDDEEKEYFDDSTEERFRKQSSQSESDSEDDFFVGKKASKFSKKKPKSVEGEKVVKAEPTDKVQSELDELESRLKSKGTSMQSHFCDSLSTSKRGSGRGRGGDSFRGRGRSWGDSGKRDFRKQPTFERQDRGEDRHSGSNYSKPFQEGRHPGSTERGRGRGRGRGDATRQNDRRGGGAFSHQAPQQALHPSWEASKKRKEQQGQILAFQGKKIKFDDD